MDLKVQLPFQVFALESGVLRIVAETHDGSLGLLPHRLDVVAAIVPGILIYETLSGGETFIAVDSGVLVKTGNQVLVSVRRAVSGTDLELLRASVMRDFLNLDQRERDVRSAITKLETSFIRRFAELSHG